MNCDSCEEPKNSLIAAEIGLALIRSCGIRFSVSACDRRSFTARSTRTRPARNWFSASSPTERTRRLPRWSMSSISPRPLRSSTRILITATMSSVGQRARARQLVAADAAVELHAADRRQVVALLGEEQAVEQRLHRVFGRRLAGAHHAVDRDLRRHLVGGLVDAQRLRDVRALVEVVGVDRLDLARRPASRSFASSSSVISSLALARISPVSLSTTLCASTRPIRNSSGTAMLLHAGRLPSRGRA